MRVAIYMRCAHPDKDQFDVQRKRCLNFATQAGYEVVGIYEDFGQSGLDENRPGLRDMLAAAQTRAFERLVVDDMYRLSRNSTHLAEIVEKLASYHVSVKPVPGDSAT